MRGKGGGASPPRKVWREELEEKKKSCREGKCAVGGEECSQSVSQWSPARLPRTPAAASLCSDCRRHGIQMKDKTTALTCKWAAFRFCSIPPTSVSTTIKSIGEKLFRFHRLVVGVAARHFSIAALHSPHNPVTWIYRAGVFRGKSLFLQTVCPCWKWIKGVGTAL